MITIENLNESITEAERFIERAKAARERLLAWKANWPTDLLKSSGWSKGEFEKRWASFGGPETSACRRASMDLTRALAKLRRRGEV